MTEAIPAIIPESLDDLRAKLTTLKPFASSVQIDITDGLFVLSQSWPMRTTDKKPFETFVRGKGPLPFSEDFSFEADLMVHAPETVLKDWVRLGITRAVFHLRSKHNFSEVQSAVGDTVELGVAIDLSAPYERLASYIPDIDYVQVMGIKTLGRQGEPFDPRAIDLVKKVRHDFPDVIIQIDGGVHIHSAQVLVESGANRLVAGSFILKAEKPQEAFTFLEEL